AFRTLAPRIMRDLLAEARFGFSRDDVAAIVGNLAHETLGFTKMQEMAPTVRGSRGGYGWAQWTGQRRVAFEA
ncbi:phage tail tip lysozyme, partial [[Ruminococcus] torques]|uniref:phage tail tip lysozyme n=1 Tax=[Ruminococcus] torques TaxID=33039 RepID=UPI001EDE3859